MGRQVFLSLFLVRTMVVAGGYLDRSGLISRRGEFWNICGADFLLCYILRFLRDAKMGAHRSELR